MKKIIIGMALIGAGICNAETNTYDYVDIYDVKMSVKVPYLDKGVRVYKAQTFKGTMTVEYSDGISAATMNVVNTKTKVAHEIDMTEGMYNLMGKTTKTSVRSTPTVFFEGSDSEDVDGHEKILKACFAGTGSIKTTKVANGGCGSCGVITLASYCTKLMTMSGNVNGIMDCQCPDEENWSHTLTAGACGVLDGELEDVRSHEAAFWGSWSAKWNKKLTEAANN